MVLSDVITELYFSCCSFWDINWLPGIFFLLYNNICQLTICDFNNIYPKWLGVIEKQIWSKSVVLFKISLILNMIQNILKLRINSQNSLKLILEEEHTKMFHYHVTEFENT